MTSTASITPTAPGVADVRDLDASAVLDFAAQRRRDADRAEADLLAAAVHWVDLHPVVDGDGGDSPGSLPATWAVPGLSVFDSATQQRVQVETPLAGAGAPAVAEFAVEELAAALGLSFQAGLQLVADAVELCYRLPRLWALVQDGRLQAWKARRVARLTPDLSREAVGFVDRHTATTGRRNRLPNLPHLVHEARLQCDPDQAAAVEQLALDRRGVWFDHRESTATTELTARLDTLDALDLENTVADLASTLGWLGDTRHVDTRRATALGMLADPQRTLDLVTGGHVDTDTTGSGGGSAATPSTGDPRATRWPNRSSAVLYLHLSAADLATGTGGGRVEKLGPATLELLHDWLQRVHRVTVRPVVDLSRNDAVDAHDPPDWMRETVILRDRHCVFPGCHVDARHCDLDHIAAYVDPDDGGPPGQTSPANLAPLCRRHHRLKTFTAWTYARDPDGSYTWTSPRRRTYTVHPD